MTVLAAYLLIGLANALQAEVRGVLSRGGEVAMYVLLWPLQLVFALLVVLHAGTEWLLERVFR